MKTSPFLTVLVIGAMGSIGRHVIEESLRQSHKIRALVRSAVKAKQLPPAVEIVVGDVTRPETLDPAIDGINAIVLTVNADSQGRARQPPRLSIMVG